MSLVVIRDKHSCIALRIYLGRVQFVSICGKRSRERYGWYRKMLATVHRRFYPNWNCSRKKKCRMNSPTPWPSGDMRVWRYWYKNVRLKMEDGRHGAFAYYGRQKNTRTNIWNGGFEDIDKSSAAQQQSRMFLEERRNQPGSGTNSVWLCLLSWTRSKLVARWTLPEMVYNRKFCYIREPTVGVDPFGGTWLYSW